jgi:hypothetical protein
MFDALEWRERLTSVTAKNALPYLTYICPVCREDVALRRGPDREYFAHLAPNHACPRYQASAGSEVASSSRRTRGIAILHNGNWKLLPVRTSTETMLRCEPTTGMASVVEATDADMYHTTRMLFSDPIVGGNRLQRHAFVYLNEWYYFVSSAGDWTLPGRVPNSMKVINGRQAWYFRLPSESSLAVAQWAEAHTVQLRKPRLSVDISRCGKYSLEPEGGELHLLFQWPVSSVAANASGAVGRPVFWSLLLHCAPIGSWNVVVNTRTKPTSIRVARIGADVPERAFIYSDTGHAAYVGTRPYLHGRVPSSATYCFSAGAMFAASVSFCDL